ncbi:MAG TPA: S16 family serine protease [Actinomycetota bacterium]|nr:S16 family serine protease [Actinomycetota bacterium]
MFRWKRLLLYGSVAAIAVAAVTVTLPWYAVGPGPARAVQPLIRFDDRPRYESEGQFVMTSVRYTQLTGVDLMLAWLDPDRYVVPRSDLFPPGEGREQEHRRSISQMDTSKLDAAAVVLRELSDYPRQHGDGVLVENVVSGCAADGELYPGDRILAIEGEEVDTWREASRAIEAAPSGATLAFDLSVDGEPENVDLVRAPCGGSEDPLVGVSLINSFPFDVEISSGEIGGPSAGLMWALGLYDLLTPGDLTGGRTIAGTGQIGIDGNVAPIDAVAQKVSAAADAGATVFLLPADNAEAAIGAGDHGLELVPVASFDDAVAYLSGSADGGG